MKRIQYVIIALAVMLSSLLASSTAIAQEGEDLPPEVVAALERLVATGVLTAEDRAIIVAYPEVASRVVDPASTTTKYESPPQLQSVGCGPVSRTQTEYTLTGAVAWRLYHRINRCWNGSRITSTTNRQAYFYDVDFNFQIGAVNTDYLSPANGVGSLVTSIYSRQITSCIPVQGCVIAKVPRITLNVRGNGTFSTSGTNG